MLRVLSVECVVRRVYGLLCVGSVCVVRYVCPRVMSE